MRLVLHDGVGWEVQDSSQSVSDSGRCRLIAGRPVPDRQDVLLEAYGHYGSTDLFSHHELLSQHRQHDVLPEPTGQTFTQPDYPLPPTAVRLVLPHGFDALLEQVEVAVSTQITWTNQVTVKPPELLHRRHGADLSDVLFVTLRAGRTTRSSSAVPESVVILQRVFTCSRTHCLAAVVVVVGPVTVVMATL